VSFVYNSKLPYFCWGISSSEADPFLTQVSDTPLYQIKKHAAHLQVPLPEYGARKSWRNRDGDTGVTPSISTTELFEGTPCDAQMPWKMFIGNAGLTIHGEVYYLPARHSFWRFTTYPLTTQNNPKQVPPNARLARWSSTAVNKPIKKLFTLAAELFYVNDTSTGYGINTTLAIDKDGYAWILLDLRETLNEFSNNTPKQGAIAIDLPSNQKATFLHYGTSVPSLASAPYQKYAFVITTEENRTYFRKHNESKWYCLTTGLNTISNQTGTWGLGGWVFLSNNKPTVSVAPPTGTDLADLNETATAEVQWSGDIILNGVAYVEPIGYKITNPGQGYVEDAALTFSRAPDLWAPGGSPGAAPVIELRPYQDWFVRRVADENGNREISLSGSAFSSAADFFITHTGNPARLTTEPVFTDIAGLVGNVFEQPFFARSAVGTVPSTIPAKTTVVGSVRKTAQEIYPLFVQFFIGQDNKLYVWDQSSPQTFNAGYVVADEGPWVSLSVIGTTQTDGVFCGVKADGKMYTWGVSGLRANGFPPGGAFFGDLTEFGTKRLDPVQIASEAEWVSAFSVGSVGFIAIRKDAICRDIDQPMEYWPDWHFGG
jgi:hypothetical protein